MDPLSISVSILAIIGAITSTIHTAKSVYNAPEELESLLNDLAEAELMVRDVKAYSGQHDENFAGLQIETLRERLVESEGLLLTLKNSVAELLAKPSYHRRYAWLKAKKKTRKLARKLEQIHKDLPRRLAEIDGSRIKLELRNLSLIQYDTNSSLSRLENLVKSTTERLADLHEAHQYHSKRVGSAIQKASFDTSTHLQILEAKLATGANITHILTSMPNSSSLTVAQTPNTKNSFGWDNNSLLGKIAAARQPPTQHSYQSIAIQSQYQPLAFCKFSCRCRCHVKQTVGTPPFLSRILGECFIGYRSLPVISKSCTDSTCKRTSQPSVYVTYYFPSWWITTRMIILSADWGIFSGPKVALAFPSIIPRNSMAINLIQSGDVEGLKLLFISGKAYPNDIMTGGTERSLMNIALLRQQWSVFKFLYQIGADVKVEEHGRTVESLACESLLIGSLPDDFKDWVAETFMWKTLDSFGFTDLHETVLGLRYTTIAEEVARLVILPNTINDQDELGNTPLLWACARGDYDAVILLLKAGADPNIPNKQLQTPLHASIQSGPMDCVTELFKFGAVMPDSDFRDWTLLHLAVFFLRPLTETFLDELLWRGADIQEKEQDGLSALNLAIDKNEHTALRWLLSHGAEYKHTAGGSNMLHFLAWFGDFESIRIMRDASLIGIDIHARDNTNDTPMDYIISPDRPERASPEMIECFTHLLNEIEARTNAGLHCPVLEELPIGAGIKSTTTDSAVYHTKKDLGPEPINSQEPSDEEDELIFHDTVEVHSYDSLVDTDSEEDELVFEDGRDIEIDGKIDKLHL